MRPARNTRRRLQQLGGDRGTTVMELVVLTGVMGIVLAGAVGIYQVSQLSYTKSASLLAAQAGARHGVDQLATELRFLGGYYTGFTGGGTGILTAAATTLTFRADMDGDSLVNGVETTLTAVVNSGDVAIPVTGSAAQVSGAFNTYPTAASNDWVCIINGLAGEVRRLSSVAGTTLTLAVAVTGSYPAGTVVRSVETVTYAYDPVARILNRTVGGRAAEIIVDNVTSVTFTYFDAAGVVTAILPAIREIQVAITTRGTDGSQRVMTTRVRPRNLG